MSDKRDFEWVYVCTCAQCNRVYALIEEQGVKDTSCPSCKSPEVIKMRSGRLYVEDEQ